MGQRAMVTELLIMDSLNEVMDPHMNLSIVEMKMVRGIKIFQQNNVTVGLSFPCIGCPAWTMIQNDIREAVGKLEGVSNVNVEIRWDKPWMKEDLSDSTRAHISSFGYQIFPMD
jgi:metal-sulfur cluster biosynthetic enzyme